MIKPIVKKYVAFSCLLMSYLLSGSGLSAQEMLGVTLGNYSGSASIMVNPAMMVNSKLYADFNLVSADVFIRNNFAYIPSSDASIYDLLQSNPDLPEYGPDNNNFLYYDNTQTKFTTANIRAMGPSAMVQVGEHAFGLNTAVRYFASGNNIPWEIPVFAYEGIKYGPLHNINFKNYDLDFSTTAWAEIGLSYAHNVYRFLDNQVSVGISVKYLIGYSGAYASSENVDYIVQNDSVIIINNMNAELGLSLPVDYNTNDFPDGGPLFKGSGLGVDLGMVYTKMRKIDKNNWRGSRLCAQEYDDYIYRLGVSILDIGRVKYKNNTQLHQFNDAAVYWENFDTTNFSNVNQLMGELSELFYGDPSATLQSTTMKIGLPTALSVQFDYHHYKNLYLGVYWIQPIRLNNHTLRRPAQLAVVPRYESKWLELSLPVSLNEYRYPRIGFAARLAFFTIGTERLGTWLGMADLNGLDIYASIKFNFGKGSCRDRSPSHCINNEYGYSKKQRQMFRKRFK